MPEENYQEEEVDQEEFNEEEVSQEESEEESDGINAIAIFSYLGILFLIPLLAAKDDDFAQYHAKQGLTLFVVVVIGMFVGAVPIIGWLLAPFISLAAIILGIIGIINVFKGKKKQLPLIGQYADQFDI